VCAVATDAQIRTTAAPETALLRRAPLEQAARAFKITPTAPRHHSYHFFSRMIVFGGGLRAIKEAHSRGAHSLNPQIPRHEKSSPARQYTFPHNLSDCRRRGVMGLVPATVMSFPTFIGFFTASSVLAIAFSDYSRKAPSYDACGQESRNPQAAKRTAPSTLHGAGWVHHTMS
jgi:hypothetical protein